MHVQNNLRGGEKAIAFQYISGFRILLVMNICFKYLLTGDRALDGYQKKKYVCKLLFIFLLGHDIDFGHMEAVNLLSSNKYSEKQIVSIFFSFRIFIAAVKKIYFLTMFFIIGLFIHICPDECKQ